jgi:histidinol-phosphate aminotransferase
MIRKLIRVSIEEINAYVPGEQPREPSLIKLNTNENPYPPAPQTLKATRDAVDDRLRLYPNPTAQPLREKLAALHKCKPKNIIIGNGSDELLEMACRAFVDPKSSGVQIGGKQRRNTIQYFTPSYSLYPVLADIHNAVKTAYPLGPDFQLPTGAIWKDPRLDSRAALTFITTPNAPSGCGYRTAQLEQICREFRGVVVLDEAYADFAKENAMALALKYDNVLVARTFSKAYSLCFQRVGYCVGHPALIEALDKIRDSYNVNGLGQIAALATLDAMPYYRANIQKIIRTREWLASELKELGFHVLPSQANFLFAAPPDLEGGEWQRKLRQKKILVRWFDQDMIRTRLRITVGTQEQAETLVKTVRQLL